MALSLFATDASRDALGYVADLPVLDRDEGLEELERLSLVSKESGRFVLLPLTKVYSEEELGKDGALEERFRERLVEYYVEFPLKLSNHWADRFGSFKPEEENLVQVIAFCLRTDRVEAFVTLVQDISHYFWMNGNWSTLKNYLKMGLKIANTYGFDLAKARFLKYLYNTNFHQGHLHEALDAIQKAIDIYQLHNDNEPLTDSLWRLGAVQIALGEYKAARQNLMKAMNLSEALTTETGALTNYVSYGVQGLPCLLKINTRY